MEGMFTPLSEFANSIRSFIPGVPGGGVSRKCGGLYTILSPKVMTTKGSIGDIPVATPTPVPGESPSIQVANNLSRIRSEAT